MTLDSAALDCVTNSISLFLQGECFKCLEYPVHLGNIDISTVNLRVTLSKEAFQTPKSMTPPEDLGMLLSVFSLCHPITRKLLFHPNQNSSS